MTRFAPSKEDVPLEIDLGTVTLKSGEEARLMQIVAPEPVWTADGTDYVYGEIA